ncbi:MAG TPA: hypothetical protein PLU49_09980 [Saprospiraceae bacterium]|nr:hypothetical protein [Flavobacterium sp.]HRE73164.1 hypothetical protein [Flavobacteriales bacterium]HRQ30389.1 hypothetical protein [Saprospiraceae bacterium]
MKLEKFLFVIPRTPVLYRQELREYLFQFTIKSLNNQTNRNWTAIVIDEVDFVDGNVIYISSKAITKREKLLFAIDWIKCQDNLPEFMIRLDDDDWISPTALDEYSDTKIDCITDRYQWMYDTINERFICPDYTWMPNTIIHKTNHALTIVDEQQTPLFASDHSKYFQLYYQAKKVKYTSRNSPLYLRILSPTNLSLSNSYGSNIGTLDLVAYKEQVNRIKRWRRFLFWRKNPPKGFIDLISRFRQDFFKYLPNAKS